MLEFLSNIAIILFIFIIVYFRAKYVTLDKDVFSSKHDESDYDNNRYVKEKEKEQEIRNERLDAALRKAETYLYRYNNMYALKNQNVSFSYNYYTLIFYCLNFINKSKKFKIDLAYEDDTSSLTELEAKYDEIFCKICCIFDNNTTYEDIYSLLQDNYTVKNRRWGNYNFGETDQYSSYESNSPYIYDAQDIQPACQENTNQYTDAEKYYGDSDLRNLIDINTASMEEISTLPGIGKLLAEKIVVTRGDIGGFTSKQEFYDRYKISTYYQIQLEDKICFSKRKIQNIQSDDYYERKIDF